MSRSILAVLFGVILSISSLSAAPATGPSGEDPNGLFATYFQNMENNPCSLANSFITGFDSTIGVTYMTPLCTSFNGSNYFSLS